MEHKASLENKAGRNAVAIHSDMKRNIPGGTPFRHYFCIARITLRKELNIADCGYQVHRTERKISHLLYMDDWKLLGRNEDYLENEIKIVKAISKDIYINSQLEKCAKICLKEGRVQSKIYIASTFGKDIKDWTREKHVHY